MLSALRFPFRLTLFWLLFFAIFRLWFVLWLYSRWSDKHPASVWQSFYHALPLDLSMTGYLILIPLLLWGAGQVMNPRIQPYFEKGIHGFNFTLVSIMVLIFGANVFLYEEWDTLLNHRALAYMRTPRALLDSMSGVFKTVSIMLYVSFVLMALGVYRRFTQHIFQDISGSRWPTLWLLPSLALTVLAIRGGLGVMPINESAVAYSDHIFDNHAATNTAWHLIHSQMEAGNAGNAYLFMDEQEARNTLVTVMDEPITPAMPWVMMPDSIRPNLVFILMESMTAQVIEELGGEANVCPNFSALTREGVLFERCYSSGFRTDQGLVAVLGGYPAQPDQSIVLQSDKAETLHSLSSILTEEANYSTLFCYGGELTFANIGSWLRGQRFEKIVSEKDFSRSEKTQRWGVDDERLLHDFLLKINDLKQPFLATALTLSLHPPYDVPYTSGWNGSTDREKFLNSAAFADKAIGAFFEEARRQPWFDQTIFVLVADHGAALPGGLGLDHPRSRQVPLLIIGKPLKSALAGHRVKAVCGHHDIPATVMGGLLGYPPSRLTQQFPWSRNLTLLADDRGFGYFTNENGLGWVTDKSEAFLPFSTKKWHTWSGNSDSVAQKQAQAYLQMLYLDFLSR